MLSLGEHKIHSFVVTEFITVPVLDKIQIDGLTGNDKNGSNSSGGSQVTTRNLLQTHLLPKHNIHLHIHYKTQLRLQVIMSYTVVGKNTFSLATMTITSRQLFAICF